MENPEEVLQALDEFQKLRPSEIPRELEDYLCFVAKTGDPVYQWSLIKPLFLEKLRRVVTDFYETSPTFDLAPSPNVQRFNYHTMRLDLVELLESFANAPFTIQRICELLTSPRKEYNRVDKFMRAMLKNILVVSTREPGPAARRSENGDSMINGSLDEDAQSHEVEMDSWVKDCTTDHVSDHVEPPKSPKSSEEQSTQDKADLSDVNNFPELSTGVLNSHEPSNTAQHMGSSADVTSIVGDVPEATMNEDTSSQPSLETDAVDADTSNSRKLQTTFQARDFAKETKIDKCEEKCSDEIVAEDESESSEVDPKPEQEEKLNVNVHQHLDLSADDPIAEKRARLDDDVESESLEPVTSIIPEESVSTERDESNIPILEGSDIAPPEFTQSADHSPPSGPSDATNVSHPSEAVETEETKETQPSDAEPEPAAEPEVDAHVETEDEAIETDFHELPEMQIPKVATTDPVNIPDNTLSKAEPEETPSEPKPIIEEPVHEDPEEKADEAEESEGVVIQEAMEDDARSTNTMIPDPIPIVEEPKEEPPVPSGEETTIAEIIEAKSPSQEIADVPEVGQKDESLDVEQPCDTDQLETVEATVTEEPMEKGEIPESMDVDSEDAMPVIQQDEPMEEECGDQLKS